MSKIQFIDTHSHIYLPEFDEDRNEIIGRSLEESVEKIIMPAIDQTTHAAMLQTEKTYSNCLSMMGLHPCSVTAGYADELEIVEEHLPGHRFMAVGETGLDFYWDKTFTDQQYVAFRRQIELAIDHQLPVVIHSRDSIDECIAVVREYPAATGVFHCFSGNYDQAKQIMSLGFMLGIGGVVTFKNSGLDKVIAQTGLSHVVLETDAPYLAPVPHRGKRNEPSYIRIIAEKISTVTGMDIQEVAKTTTENAIKLFSLSRLL